MAFVFTHTHSHSVIRRHDYHTLPPMVFVFTHTHLHSVITRHDCHTLPPWCLHFSTSCKRTPPVSGQLCFSLRSKRLSNVGRAVLGNAGGARSTREGKGKPALLVFPYFYTARPKLHKRLLRRLAMFGPK